MNRPIIRATLPLLLSALLVLPAGELMARSVYVRLFQHTYDPAKDTNTSFGARTTSVKKDRLYMGDPKDPSSQAYTKTEMERNEGYPVGSLASNDQTGFSAYLPENVPTHIAYCSGHVLMMASKQLKSGGPLPPVAAGGDALYKAAKIWGTKSDKLVGEKGNVVFYFQPGNDKPDHVAHVLPDGQVISKDHAQRVYILPREKVNPGTYTRRETWTIPWNLISAQIVAGPIELLTDSATGKPSCWEVKPPEPWAGDALILRFAWRVQNAPAGNMEVKAEATLRDSRGDLVGTSQSRILPSTRSDPNTLVGTNSFFVKVEKPGQHIWNLEISGKQAPSQDESMAYYEPFSTQITFQVKGRPAISDVKITAATNQVRQSETMTIQAHFRVTGLPTDPKAFAGGVRPRIEYCAQALPTSKPPKFKELSAISANGEVNRKGKKTITVRWPPGNRKLRLTLRLVDVPGILPAKSEKSCEFDYEVLAQ